MSRIPNGTYRGKAIPDSHRLGRSKNKGTEQSEVEFELTQEGFTGTRITWVGYYTERTEDRTLESLRHAGWTGDDLAASPLPGLGSTEVDLVIENEEYDGKTRSKVAFVNKPGGIAMGVPMDDVQRRSFADRMRAKIALQKNGAGTATPSSGGAKTTDDLPF
jgi:hypothetical protein